MLFDESITRTTSDAVHSISLGTRVGAKVGEWVGGIVGGSIGTLVGGAVGVRVGVAVGGSVGVCDGEGLGGRVVGSSVGVTEGVGVGTTVGVVVGKLVGECVDKVLQHMSRNALKFSVAVFGMPAKVHDAMNLLKASRQALLHLGRPPSEVKAMKLPQNCCTFEAAWSSFTQLAIAIDETWE
jgi:hypothetical protein